eukprot:11399511-Karenia_brevis.AAC.1
MPVLAKNICPIQRGFCRGRDFVENVVELDAQGRAYSLQAQVDGGDDLFRPFLLFLDIAAAFPSVSWQYLWAVLKAYGMPM